MTKRALVIGGGGATGNAWLIGVIAGLFDGGLDVANADLVIGTSAGSTTAAQLIGASKATELYAKILAETPPPPRPAGSSNLMEITSGIIAGAADPTDMRRKLGAALMEMDGASPEHRRTQWRATVAARLPNHAWPAQRLLVTAVDANSGEPVVFDHDSGVDLVDAVAASTAGGFAYMIGDKRYIDGGYRANENADLAAGYDRVLVLSPLGGRSRHPVEWGTRLDAHAEELRKNGSRVETILPDADSQKGIGIGMNLMDLSARPAVARAGYNQGKAAAERLAEFWR